MPITIEDVASHMGNFGYKVEFIVKAKERLGDNLLGAFKGAILEGKTSTQLIREMRDSGYGDY